ncbi:hypothetical protein U1Q18_048044 [Sarracenia purpurea var. burkii]
MKKKAKATNATAIASVSSTAMVPYGTPSAPSFSPTSILSAQTEIVSLLDTMISSLKSFEALVHDGSCHATTSLTNARTRVNAKEISRSLNQHIEALIDNAHDAIQK